MPRIARTSRCSSRRCAMYSPPGAGGQGPSAPDLDPAPRRAAQQVHPGLEQPDLLRHGESRVQVDRFQQHRIRWCVVRPALGVQPRDHAQHVPGGRRRDQAVVGAVRVRAQPQPRVVDGRAAQRLVAPGALPHGRPQVVHPAYGRVRGRAGRLRAGAPQRHLAGRPTWPGGPSWPGTSSTTSRSCSGCTATSRSASTGILPSPRSPVRSGAASSAGSGSSAAVCAASR